MRSEADEIWSAMKNAKYRDTLSELHGLKQGNVENLTAFMNEILSVVARAVHAEVATLWYYSKFVDGLIHPKAVYGGGDLTDFTLKPGEGVAGYVIEKGEGTLIENCQKDPRWSGKADDTTGFITKSMICVPICDGKACFGCIQLINRTDGNLYDHNDFDFIMLLANEVAKIVQLYSSAFIRGCFDAFEDAKKTNDYNEIFNSKDENELMECIRNHPQYQTMKSIEKMAFSWHCKKLWRVLK